jgi:hypothetical protein
MLHRRQMHCCAFAAQDAEWLTWRTVYMEVNAMP